MYGPPQAAVRIPIERTIPMSTGTQSKSITLYFREGGSDKVYQASLRPKGAGFVVNFAFGRRGSTLQTGTKTVEPVDHEAAVKVYERLIREKLAKGYTPGQDGTPYQGTERETLATGILPQLLNPVDQGQAEQLISNDDWWMQEKFDGKRILIRKNGDQVTGINRKGLAVALPQPIAQQALAIGSRQWLMDGEAVGDTYFAFDLLEQNGTDLRKEPYSRRIGALSDIVVAESKEAIRVRGTATSAAQKASCSSGPPHHIRRADPPAAATSSS